MEQLRVEVEVDSKTGDRYIKTIGQTVTPEMFSSLVKSMEEKTDIPRDNRVITLVNGEKKTCAYATIYQNTGMTSINFTGDEQVYERLGVILEDNEAKGTIDIYIDPQILKSNYDEGVFQDFFENEVGLVEGEDEENLRRMETYIRLMEKQSSDHNIQTELHFNNTIQIGALALYFGNMIINNAPGSEWRLNELDKLDVAIETIETGKFVISPLYLFKEVYQGNGVSVLEVFEKSIALSGTRLNPLLVEMMEGDITKEQAMEIIQASLTQYISGESSKVKRDYSKEKIGRNDLCPCGSGDKYKKCCMNENKTEESLIKFHEEPHHHGGVATFAFAEIDGKVERLGKHYSESGLCYWKPMEIRHTIEDVEEWKKMVRADAELHLGIR